MDTYFLNTRKKEIDAVINYRKKKLKWKEKTGHEKN